MATMRQKRLAARRLGRIFAGLSQTLGSPQNSISFADFPSRQAGVWMISGNRHFRHGGIDSLFSFLHNDPAAVLFYDPKPLSSITVPPLRTTPIT